MDNVKQYMPYVAQQMDRFREKAANARQEAARMLVKAEIWEDAASLIEIALDKERSAQGKKGDSNG